MAKQETVAKALFDLVVIFGEPGMLEEKAMLYSSIFADVDDAALEQACRAWQVKGRRFPYPADLIDMFKKQTPPPSRPTLKTPA